MNKRAPQNKQPRTPSSYFQITDNNLYGILKLSQLKSKVINSHNASMDTSNTDVYCAMASHSTALPAIPWLMQNCYANIYSCQASVFPPCSMAPIPLTFRNQLFHCSSPPQSQKVIPTNTSFLIKDILGSSDSSSQTTQVTGEAQQSDIQLRNMPSSMFSFYVLPTQKERYKQLGYSRTRTVFTRAQTNELEASFKQKQYLSTPERLELAKSLGLNPLTLKTWYQNRRMKWKREMQKVDPSCNPTRPKGRPPKYSLHDKGVEDEVIVD